MQWKVVNTLQFENPMYRVLHEKKQYHCFFHGAPSVSSIIGLGK